MTTSELYYGDPGLGGCGTASAESSFKLVGTGSVPMIQVDEKSIPWEESMTVTRLIHILGESYDYPAVRLNGKIISRPQFDHTIVPDGAKIFLIPLVAGG